MYFIASSFVWMVAYQTNGEPLNRQGSPWIDIRGADRRHGEGGPPEVSEGEATDVRHVHRVGRSRVRVSRLVVPPTFVRSMRFFSRTLATERRSP
jgi:hypothetical protein